MVINTSVSVLKKLRQKHFEYEASIGYNSEFMASLAYIFLESVKNRELENNKIHPKPYR